MSRCLLCGWATYECVCDIACGRCDASPFDWPCGACEVMGEVDGDPLAGERLWFSHRRYEDRWLRSLGRGLDLQDQAPHVRR